ncbi:MAG: Rne/Rng family ribonuclease [Alphaproteobacteria bacterium]|nr:Rne/Rng family ribonuclease [Alphaproteobacteria bacterium]
MAKRMLVDASHPEETRVAIVSGNRLEELDFETTNKAQLKGNIYLAKVTRVEPSLQAAFVDYGGNRHGFLAFSEIHPDYYKLPIADRERLLAEEAAIDHSDHAEDDSVARPEQDSEGSDDPGSGVSVELVGGDEIDDMGGRRRRRIDRYKIQEVIKRRQILLVQVVKEERGNKGAALTTYISLAGRYCVLMPNTARGGGVSRKITSPSDRRQLKGFVEDLEIPEGMAVIVRTAGAERSKAEIRRDYEYLARTWEEIRSTTLQSTAPAMIHEEANLIKRSIRDLYSRDIDEILVEGTEGYRVAKDFMRKLTPSHAKRVQPYRDETIPLFHRYQVESQIDSIHSPVIQLKSGGYIVMNPTEALVSIDVNSGKATKERHIEETAYKTNLEAAEEIARQLRLRDLAGLIVIDFIDMEDSRNQTGVERRLKDALRVDRARIQVGRISPFGLLEMSRQRLRPSLIETSTRPCAHCNGLGFVRSTESMALHALRAIEEEGIRQRCKEISIYVPTNVTLYILNQKRQILADIEQRYGFRVFVSADDSLIPPELRIERSQLMGDDGQSTDEPAPAPATAEPERDSDGKERRRRRPRRRKRDGADEQTESQADTEDAPGDVEASSEEDRTSDESEESLRRKRRRGRRGGRRRGRQKADDAAPSESSESDKAAAPASESTPTSGSDEAPVDAVESTTSDNGKPKERRRRRRAAKPATKRVDNTDAGSDDKDPAAKPPAVPTKSNDGESDSPTTAGRGSFEQPSGPSWDISAPAAQPIQDVSEEPMTAAPKRGWWRRLTDD